MANALNMVDAIDWKNGVDNILNELLSILKQ
jgi:hypothetical protein